MHHLNQIIRTPSLPDQHYLQPLHFTLASSLAEKTVVDSNPVVRGVGSFPWWSGGEGRGVPKEAGLLFLPALGKESPPKLGCHP
jgi:hypothetical protein